MTMLTRTVRKSVIKKQELKVGCQVYHEQAWWLITGEGGRLWWKFWQLEPLNQEKLKHEWDSLKAEPLKPISAVAHGVIPLPNPYGKQVPTGQRPPPPPPQGVPNFISNLVPCRRATPFEEPPVILWVQDPEPDIKPDTTHQAPVLENPDSPTDSRHA
jgi:hypothetical protein